MGGSPGRLMAWTLVSRTRYGMVWSGINVVSFLGLLALGGVLTWRGLLLAIPVFLIGSLIQGWIWYPRTRRKLTARGANPISN